MSRIIAFRCMNLYELVGEYLHTCPRAGIPGFSTRFVGSILTGEATKIH